MPIAVHLRWEQQQVRCRSAPDDAFGGRMLPAVRVDERRGDDKRELVLVGFD